LNVNTRNTVTNEPASFLTKYATSTIAGAFAMAIAAKKRERDYWVFPGERDYWVFPGERDYWVFPGAGVFLLVAMTTMAMITIITTAMAAMSSVLTPAAGGALVVTAVVAV